MTTVKDLRERRGDEAVDCVVALSGGVDSAVAAALLLEAGLHVAGVMLHLHDSEASAAAEASAREVAAQLGIELVILDERRRFAEQVIAPLAAAYAAGETPNPCVGCNRDVKFSLLLEAMRRLGATQLATGHYARVWRDETTGRWVLARGLEAARDQSYMLGALEQAQLAYCLFPCGELTKDEIRARAAGLGLTVAGRPDSQDICFIPDGDYRRFLEDWRGQPEPEGDFVDGEGRVLGRHRGLSHYTVGQRRGLGVAAAERLFVQRIDAAQNRIVLAPAEAIAVARLEARAMNWVSIAPPAAPLVCMGRTRYRQRERRCTLTPLPEGRAQLHFDPALDAAAPGQAVVLYDGDRLLGAGIIDRPLH